MRHILTCPRTRARAIRGALTALIVLALPPSWARADAVDDLRRALVSLSKDELVTPSQEILEYRRDTLQKKTSVLKGIRELRSALALEEWKEFEKGDISI